MDKQKVEWLQKRIDLTKKDIENFTEVKERYEVKIEDNKKFLESWQTKLVEELMKGR